MARTTSFNLGEHFDALIAGEVASGQYGNASEVLREGLRLLEMRKQRQNAKLEALRGALIEGENSGTPTPYSFEEMKANVRKRLSKVL
jgi:antitoxin ParD1/3/4